VLLALAKGAKDPLERARVELAAVPLQGGDECELLLVGHEPIFAGADGGSCDRPGQSILLLVLAGDDYPEDDVQHDLRPGEQGGNNEERPHFSARPTEPIRDRGADAGDPASFSRTNQAPRGHDSGS
jgi:hypothetical protein